jgi:hypothetical protein
VWKRRTDSAVVISSCFFWSHPLPKEPLDVRTSCHYHPRKRRSCFACRRVRQRCLQKPACRNPPLPAATPAPWGANSHENWFWFGRNMVVPRELPALVLVVTNNSPNSIPAPATRAMHMYHHNRRSHTRRHRKCVATALRPSLLSLVAHGSVDLWRCENVYVRVSVRLYQSQE